MDRCDKTKQEELLKLAQSFINCTAEEIAAKYPQIKNTRFYPRFYYLNFEGASIKFIINILGVCDICYVEFDLLDDTDVCRDLCNEHFAQIKEELWVDSDYFIQYTLGANENGFRVTWRHDEVLGLKHLHSISHA